MEARGRTLLRGITSEKKGSQLIYLQNQSLKGMQELGMIVQNLQQKEMNDVSYTQIEKEPNMM